MRACILSSPCSFIGNDCSREIFVRRLRHFFPGPLLLIRARDPVLFIIPIRGTRTESFDVTKSMYIHRKSGQLHAR